MARRHGALDGDTSGAHTVRVRRATPDDATRAATLFDAYRVFYGERSNAEAARAFLAARLARRESIVLLATCGGRSRTRRGRARSA